MRIRYLTDDFLAVETGNNREVENALRDFATARWNNAEFRWEVHLSHLPDLITLFRLQPDRLPAALMERFEKSWLRCDARIEVGHHQCRILGSRIPVRELDSLLSFDVAERADSVEYLDGEWDGRRHLYDRRTFSFPTGLLESVCGLLTERRLRYETIDQRSERTPAPAVAETLLAPLDERDRALVELVRTEGRFTAIRERSQQVPELMAALAAAAAGRAVFTVPNDRTLAALEKKLPEGIRPFRTAADLDAPCIVLSLEEYTRLFSPVEQAANRLTGDEKKRLLMLGLRLRRERAIFALDAEAGDAETLYRIAGMAPEAPIRVAIARTNRRGDGMDLLVTGAFGPARVFALAGDDAKAGTRATAILHRLRAPEYRRIERDRPLREILRNGIHENESRNELIARLAKEAKDRGYRMLVLAESPKYREKLREAIGDGTPIHTVAEVAPMVAKAKRPYPLDVLLVAEAAQDPGAVLAALFPLTEAMVPQSAGKVGEGRKPAKRAAAKAPAESNPVLHVYDFDDPLPVVRRTAAMRWDLYALHPGWLEELTEAKARRKR